MATTYAQAGVDQDRKDSAIEILLRMMRKTYDPGVMEIPWGFAGLYSLKSSPLFDRPMKDPVLVACADGVGTKVKLAQQMKIYDTVGIDLVAMCVNDLICTGGRPLFFLDYMGLGDADPERVLALAKGVIEGCRQGQCALLGGETAEMPGVYKPEDYDLAGFSVGIVEKSRILDGKSVKPGDDVIALPSSGIHSNGYSLVRKIVKGEDLDAPFGRTTLGKELLKPTRIYVKAIGEVLRRYKVKRAVKAVAHITGGGTVENIPRVLPPDCSVEIEEGSWTIPPIFPWLQERGGVPRKEMFRVFNMGIGMVLITAPYYTKPILATLKKSGERARLVGKVVPGSQEVLFRKKG